MSFSSPLATLIVTTAVYRRTRTHVVTLRFHENVKALMEVTLRRTLVPFASRFSLLLLYFLFLFSFLFFLFPYTCRGKGVTTTSVMRRVHARMSGNSTISYLKASRVSFTYFRLHKYAIYICTYMFKAYTGCLICWNKYLNVFFQFLLLFFFNKSTRKKLF